MIHLNDLLAPGDKFVIGKVRAQHHKDIRNKWYRDEVVLALPTAASEVARFDNFNIKTLKDVKYHLRKKSVWQLVQAHGLLRFKQVVRNLRKLFPVREKISKKV